MENRETMLITFGTCCSKASSRCIEIFGFARRTSKIVSIFDAVASETFPLSRFTLNNNPPERNTEFPMLLMMHRHAMNIQLS